MTETANEPFLTLMGTGTSMGVPMIGCDCPVCMSDNPKNYRTRSGVVVQNGERGFLIDTGPELRIQMLREGIRDIDAVVFTHAHADHILGLDDLRIFGFRHPDPVPLYCEQPVEETLRRTFAYAFDDNYTAPHSRPRLQFQRIGEEPFHLSGLKVQPIRVLHGQLPILGFRINDVAFCTDASGFAESSWPLLEDLRVLIVGAIRHKPHPTHFNIEQALEVVNRVRPKQTYLTHISHSLDHDETNRELPKGVQLAFDGLRIPL